MKWLRKILKGASFASALFIFQACYGPGPVWEPEPGSEEEEFIVSYVDKDLQEEELTSPEDEPVSVQDIQE